MLCCALPARVQAQVAGSISLSSNEEFRGTSTDGDNPSATAGVSYDHASGLYAGVSATLIAQQGVVRFNTATQYAGYAVRRDGRSFELGVVHRSYRQHLDPDYDDDYWEGYVGVSTGRFAARIYISPDYPGNGQPSGYGDFNLRIATVENWTLSAHGGVLVMPSDRVPAGPLRLLPDWRVAVGRPVGAFDVRLALSDGKFDALGSHSGPRLVASAGFAF